MQLKLPSEFHEYLVELIKLDYTAVAEKDLAEYANISDNLAKAYLEQIKDKLSPKSENPHVNKEAPPPPPINPLVSIDWRPANSRVIYIGKDDPFTKRKLNRDPHLKDFGIKRDPPWLAKILILVSLFPLSLAIANPLIGGIVGGIAAIGMFCVFRMKDVPVYFRFLLSSLILLAAVFLFYVAGIVTDNYDIESGLGSIFDLFS